MAIEQAPWQVKDAPAAGSDRGASLHRGNDVAASSRDLIGLPDRLR